MMLRSCFDEESFSSCPSNEDIDDVSKVLHVGMDLCAIWLEPTNNQLNVTKEDFMVMLSPNFDKARERACYFISIVSCSLWSTLR
mgnify:CR=1 FL=1